MPDDRLLSFFPFFEDAGAAPDTVPSVVSATFSSWFVLSFSVPGTSLGGSEVVRVLLAAEWSAVKVRNEGHL